MLLNPQKQTVYCIKECSKTEHECYLANAKDIQWKSEQQVIHVDETGSQWRYKARSGVALVACPQFQTDVQGLIFQTSVMCERLMYLGYEWNFNGKAEVTMRTETEEITMQCPSFGLTAVCTGLPQFTEIIEKECENHSTIEQFILRREPWPSP